VPRLACAFSVYALASSGCDAFRDGTSIRSTGFCLPGIGMPRCNCSSKGGMPQATSKSLGIAHIVLMSCLFLSLVYYLVLVFAYSHVCFWCFLLSLRLVKRRPMPLPMEPVQSLRCLMLLTAHLTVPLQTAAALSSPLLMCLTLPLPTLHPTLHPLLPHRVLQAHARKSLPLHCLHCS
jgi:hypothetical protein